MSCTPTSALSRSLSPLSPSDESRFVPRESVASAINEQHFTAAEKADKGADTGEDAPESGVNIAEAVGAAGQAASKERAQDVDDEKSGIVGATICFTPKPSPKSGPRPPPLFRDELPRIGSLTINTHSDDYIGSIAAAGSGSGLVASSKMGSASMHVASSLDGRSTTEYELISKGSIEVEDLILEGEEDGGYGGSGGAKSGGGNVTPLASLSPCGTVPSLDEAPLEAFTGVAESEVPAEINLKEDTSPDDAAAEEEPKSPKVDSSPLHPFKNLHKYWEAKSTNFAHMTKSTLGRFFGKESAQGADGDVDADTSEQDPVTEASEDATPAVEADASADAIVKTSSLPFAAAKAYLSGLAASAASFVASAFLLLAMLLRGSLSSWLESISNAVGRILLRKRLVEADKAPSSDAPTSGAGTDEPQEPEGVNLSKLFADEAREKESEVGLEQVPAQPADAKEPELATATALGHSKKASLNKIVDLVTGFLAAQTKNALALLKTKQVLQVLTPLFVLVNVFLLCVYMLRRGAGVAHEGESGILGGVSFEEEDLNCALTEATSYASIPVSELNLSPTFSDEDASARSGPSVWMWIFGVVAILIGCAFVFKAKLSSLIVKREGSSTVTGIWAEFEHEQFLRGFRAHGKRWKLVSAYVPTRTPTQVRAHGSYWLKVRSPDGMKKSRRSSIPAMTPERSSLGAPGSVSSRKTTPRTSNKSKAATPKGILVEKRFKNVTPRSEERAKRMKKTEGPMSDPPKRRARIKNA